VAALTVLYDETCRACTALARWLQHRGRDVAVAPIGSAQGARLLRDLTPAERYATVHAVDARGRRRSGGAAVPPVLRSLPGGAGPGALAAALPRVTDAAYRWLSARRGLLGRVL
jgi:predicted DCC family thiol-disulfide oxidoreductase YuxK